MDAGLAKPKARPEGEGVVVFFILYFVCMGILSVFIDVELLVKAH